MIENSGFFQIQGISTNLQSSSGLHRLGYNMQIVVWSSSCRNLLLANANNVTPRHPNHFLALTSVRKGIGGTEMWHHRLWWKR